MLHGPGAHSLHAVRRAVDDDREMSSSIGARIDAGTLSTNKC